MSTLSYSPPWRALTPGIDTWQASDINQYLATHPLSFSYDSSGRILTITEQSASKVTNFLYSGVDRRPIEITESVQTFNSSLTYQVRFSYGSNGFFLNTYTVLGQNSVVAWHAPVSGDRPLASDSNQFLFTHPHVDALYDSSYRITQISEDSSAQRLIQFAYTGTSRRPTGVTEQVAQTTGSFSQDSVLNYASGQLSTITQSVVNVPSWTAAMGGNINISAGLRQLLALHQAAYSYDPSNRLLTVDEETSNRVDELRYPVSGDRRPSTIEEITSSQVLNITNDIKRSFTYTGRFGQVSQAA